MTLSPVIEWRAATTPFAVLASQAMAGSGFAGAIPAGTSSGVVTVRLYNNFASAASIADALSCQLAVYDDAIHQGTATTTPTIGQYVQVQVADYNGVATDGDTFYYLIGGSVKHPLPTNGGTIGGAGANYVTINIKIVVPAAAMQGSVSQGVWIEYTATA